MNSSAGARDQAKIEVVKGHPPIVGGASVRGFFEIEAHHANGEQFYQNTVENATTTEWLTEMLEIFGGPNANVGADHTGGAEENGIISSLVQADATYGTPGTTQYQFLVGIGTAAAPSLDQTTMTYANIDDTDVFTEVAASTAGITGYTRQEFSLGDGITHNTTGVNVTVTNGSGGSRASWVRGGSDTGTLTVTCVMLVFSHSTASDHATVGGTQTLGSLNRLVACADLGASDVNLLASDTINVRYTYQLAASG